MTAFSLKTIGIITMTIDHLGLFFFPKINLLRMIGRLSFPLFAWLIANGAYNTKNIDRYLARIGIFAIISQPFYLLAHRLLYPGFVRMNVLVTLFLGLAAIKLIKHKSLIVRYFGIFIIFSLTLVIKIDYGLKGVLSIIAFYLFFKNPVALILTQTIIYTSKYIYFAFMINPTNLLSFAQKYKFFAPLALLSIPITFPYNSKKGKGLKYFFYLFYSLQYIFYYFAKLSLL